jgi:hypothetical protein
MSIKISNFLQKELEYENVNDIFLTDRKVVLGYVNNKARRFHIFIANRVQKIRDVTSPDQWHHIGTKENQADLVS